MGHRQHLLSDDHEGMCVSCVCVRDLLIRWNTGILLVLFEITCVVMPSVVLCCSQGIQRKSVFLVDVT